MNRVIYTLVGINEKKKTRVTGVDTEFKLLKK